MLHFFCVLKIWLCQISTYFYGGQKHGEDTDNTVCSFHFFILSHWHMWTLPSEYILNANGIPHLNSCHPSPGYYHLCLGSLLSSAVTDHLQCALHTTSKVNLKCQGWHFVSFTFPKGVYSYPRSQTPFHGLQGPTGSRFFLLLLPVRYYLATYLTLCALATLVDLHLWCPLLEKLFPRSLVSLV